jgi:hypothetical protein
VKQMFIKSIFSFKVQGLSVLHIQVQPNTRAMCPFQACIHTNMSGDGPYVENVTYNNSEDIMR